MTILNSSHSSDFQKTDGNVWYEKPDPVRQHFEGSSEANHFYFSGSQNDQFVTKVKILPCGLF